jgi:putative N-acetyltransferase (TIGR04045 family)
MPGKATVSIEHYFAAFEKAVDVFGRGQVSTYILAGLGDTSESILRMCERLIAVGVYPFVVPFVPISGTLLESHPAPSAQFMRPLLAEIATLLDAGDLRSADQKAGCGKCGACSSLASYERPATIERKIEIKPLHPLIRREDFHDPIRWNDPISGRPAAPRLFESDVAVLETQTSSRVIATQAFTIKIAQSPVELEGYAKLRREVFCDEQKLFAFSDQDEHDADAIPIVAVAGDGIGDSSVIGTVRIYQTEPGVWYGSRLAVAQGYRGIPGLSAGLIRMAVCTAHGLGCQKFLANVQRQNVPLFRRLHWKSFGMIDVCGLPHHLMQADLDHYPPQAAP